MTGLSVELAMFSNIVWLFLGSECPLECLIHRTFFQSCHGIDLQLIQANSNSLSIEAKQETSIFLPLVHSKTSALSNIDAIQNLKIFLELAPSSTPPLSNNEAMQKIRMIQYQRFPKLVPNQILAVSREHIQKVYYGIDSRLHPKTKNKQYLTNFAESMRHSNMRAIYYSSLNPGAKMFPNSADALSFCSTVCPRWHYLLALLDTCIFLSCTYCQIVWKF